MVFEILQYELKPGTLATFSAVMIAESAPLHRQSGIEIVFHGPIEGDPCGYVLVRKFADFAQVDQGLQDFYASAAWRDGPRQKLIASIAKTARTLVAASGT
jgi:hypothetical protein